MADVVIDAEKIEEAFNEAHATGRRQISKRMGSDDE